MGTISVGGVTVIDAVGKIDIAQIANKPTFVSDVTNTGVSNCPVGVSPSWTFSYAWNGTIKQWSTVHSGGTPVNCPYNCNCGACACDCTCG